MKKTRGIIAILMVIIIFWEIPIMAMETQTKTGKTEISVFVESSLRYTMEEIIIEFQKQYPDTNVFLHTDATSVLYAQLQEKFACDIILLDSMEVMDELVEEGIVQKESVTQLLENKIVLIRPEYGKTEVTGFDTLIQASNLALPSENNAIREYAVEILENLNIWKNVKWMEIQEGKNTSEVLGDVRAACNEVGIVYATDALFASNEVEVIAQAPDELLSAPILYSAALTNQNFSLEQKNAATNFMRFLQTETAEMVFKTYGFIYLERS